MFRKYFHNPIINLLTRFVVASLLVVMLCGVATPLAQAQASGDPGSAVGNFIGNMIITVGASFAKLGGLALDFAVDYLVIRMGDLMNGEQLRGAIDSLWTVIRDICNLAFIFAFIYVGIRTILDADNVGTKRMLAQIIMGAFLINFSLLFTKIIIDFSNLTAIAVKNGMLPNGSFSVNFTQQLGLNGLYDLADAKTLADMTKGGGIWYSLLATLFLLVTAFVFMAGAVLLVVRFVALVFIMIFSPVLFAATLFPQTSEYSKKILSNLISYSFFAPVYFLLLLISMRVVEAIKPIAGGHTFSTSITTGQVTMSGSVILFTIAIIFMVQSLLLAQKLGMAGGDKAVAWGKSLRSYGQRAAGSMTFGAAGAAGRATIGRYGNKLANDETLKNRAATSWSARQKLKLARGAADSSFDGRKVGGLGKNLGIGEGSKGGYQTIQKEITEKEKKFAESLGEVGDDDVRVMARKKEMQAEEKRLRKLEEELNAIDKSDVAARTTKREEIESQKNKIVDSKTNYEKEKQRRQIGSTFAIDSNPTVRAEVARINSDVVREKAELKKLWEGDPATGTWAYSDPSLSITEKEHRRADIQAQMNKIADLEKKIKAQQATLTDRGYAGVLEKSRRLTSWPIGRLAHQERESGEEIRKTAEKGLPKKKDD